MAGANPQMAACIWRKVMFVMTTRVKVSMTSDQKRGAAGAAAGLMLLLWLGIFTLTAWPDLHSLFHHDAQAAGHHCILTLMQHHSMLTGFVSVTVPATQFSCTEFPGRAECQFALSRDYRLSPSRAPPMANSFLAVVGWQAG